MIDDIVSNAIQFLIIFYYFSFEEKNDIWNKIKPNKTNQKHNKQKHNKQKHNKQKHNKQKHNKQNLNKEQIQKVINLMLI
jgi:hypothetical protein